MSRVDQPAYAGPNPAREFVARAFGAENRARLLAQYFDDHPLGAKQGVLESLFSRAFGTCVLPKIDLWQSSLRSLHFR